VGVKSEFLQVVVLCIGLMTYHPSTSLAFVSLYEHEH